ncbi:MAG TPA: TolC family protein, partial [Myxococcota bacterium]|nr:TolC family protein [Myxococcota bacterium]
MRRIARDSSGNGLPGRRAARGWKCALLLAVALAASPAAAGEPAVMTLDAAVARALRAAPSLAGAAADVDAARARERVAMTGWLPSLSGTAAYNRQTGNFAPR